MGIEQFLEQRFINLGIEKGMEKGIEEKNLAFTKTLLSETDFSLEKIAALVGVPVSFVENVKASM